MVNKMLNFLLRYKYFWILAVFLIACLPVIYYGFKQVEENKIVADYLRQNNFDTLSLSRQAAFKVAGQVALDFNVNQKTFKVLDLDARPFLREDAGTLLTCREGLCGEGTRVIVRLLNELGFDATRITLYDRYMQYAHTLVSVNMDDDAFWIDSINSRDSLTNLLARQSISADDFNYLFYEDNIEARLKKIEDYMSAEKAEGFKQNLGMYYMFSYEAIPWTKLLSKVGVNARVFNFERPPRFVSVLAEKPLLITTYFYLVVAFTATGATWIALNRMQRRLKRRDT
jgi:hypothetical protein